MYFHKEHPSRRSDYRNCPSRVFFYIVKVTCYAAFFFSTSAIFTYLSVKSVICYICLLNLLNLKYLKRVIKISSSDVLQTADLDLTSISDLRTAVKTGSPFRYRGFPPVEMRKA